MDSWHLNPIMERYLGGGAYLLVSVITLLLLAAWVASVCFVQLPTIRRLLLGSLRILAIAVLLFAMLRPTLVFTEMQQQSATLIVLIDRSRSMLVEDTASGQARWQELKKTIADATGNLRNLRDDRELEIKVYAFDSDLEETPFTDQLQLDETPTGTESAIGRVMREALRREDGKRLVGLVLLSDGAQQTIGPSTDNPDAIAGQFAQLGCPVYVVPFGNRKGTSKVRDIAIDSMPDDLVVFVKNQLTVTGTLRVSGYSNQDIPLQLVMETDSGKEEVLATDKLRAKVDGEQLRFELSHTPQTGGQFKVTVRALPQDGEVTTTNNELSTYLTVLDGGLRVLYLQGEVRPEQRFLRRALSASPDIDVTLLTLHTRDHKNWPAADLKQYFQPGGYDVYILGDLDSDAFHGGEPAQDQALPALKSAIEKGAGLLVLGGWHSLRPGGYQHTVLTDLLPIEMDSRIDRFVRQKIGEPVDETLHLTGPVRMRPAEPAGMSHPVMRLTAEDNRMTWSKLPALSGANLFRGVKDGAEVLAEDEQGQPLLVSGEPAGRVLVFAGDSTWRWVMHGKKDLHRRFWRQAILWLARKEDDRQESVWVKLDGRRFAPGQKVTFSAGARTAEGDPLPNALLNAHILQPDGKKRPVRLVRHGDQLRGTIRDIKSPGSYEVEVKASVGDKHVGTDSAQFLVYAKDRELSGSTSDITLLESIAARTHDQGGRMVPAEELAGLFAEMADQPLKTKERVSTSVTYWDRWYVLVIFVSLIGTEWFLRKRWRLV